MGCSPLVWWEEEELSQAKKHREETEKEGWCLDEEEGALVGESTAYVTFKAWNLLTSRGICVQCLFSQQHLRRTPTPCKHLMRQGHRGRKAPTLPQRRKITKRDYVGQGKEVFPFYSYKTSYFGPHCQRAGRVLLSKYCRTSQTELRT